LRLPSSCALGYRSEAEDCLVKIYCSIRWGLIGHIPFKSTQTALSAYVLGILQLFPIKVRFQAHAPVQAPAP
jgi:hypothetical protein